MNKFMILILFVALSVSLTFAEEDCHIVFGITYSSKQFGWPDKNGKPTGLNIDLVDSMTRGAGCTYEVVVLPTWSGLVDALENRKITMMHLSPFKRTDSFAIYIPLSHVEPRYIFTRAGEPVITLPEELKGKSVVVTGGGFSDGLLTDMRDDLNIEILRYPSSEEALRAFSQGRGDALISTVSIVMNLMDTYSSKKIVFSNIPLITPIGAFALHKSDIVTYTRLTKALEEMKTRGEYFDILKKWAVPPKPVAWYNYVLTAAMVLAAVILVAFIWIKSLQIQVARRTAQLNKLRDEALMAGKLAVLGEMSANIAHEINNPTGLMVHNADFLRDFCARVLDTAGEYISEEDMICGFPLRELRKETHAVINSMDECLLRIRTTVDELKSYTSRSPDKLEMIDIRACIQSAVKFSNYFIRKYTNNFSVQFTEPLMPFLGNTLEIEQMVVNLIHNSCLSLTRRDATITCAVRAAENGRFMLVAVTDEGCGMSEDTAHKARNAFFTTRKETGGTGLGLSIVDRIMGEHGGHYTIESVLGKGTTVSLYFPVPS